LLHVLLSSCFRCEMWRRVFCNHAVTMSFLLLKCYCVTAILIAVKSLISFEVWAFVYY
jgi:hypothetical protein